MPDKERLEGCFENNSDGAGFMFPKGGKVYYQKGLMDFNTFHTELLSQFQTEEEILKTPIVMHFRIGTHGDKKAPTHTHPFPLTEDMNEMVKLEGSFPYVIAHNGIISSPMVGKWKYPTGEKDEKGEEIYIHPSDTMDYVHDILYPMSKIPDWFNSKMAHRLVNFSIGYSKLVIMKGDGSLLYFGGWEQPDKDINIFYSNKNYYKRVPITTYKDKYYDRDYDDDYWRDWGYKGKVNENRAQETISPSNRTSTKFPHSKFRASKTAFSFSPGDPQNLFPAKKGSKIFMNRSKQGVRYFPDRDGVLVYRIGTSGKVWLYEMDVVSGLIWYVSDAILEEPGQNTLLLLTGPGGTVTDPLDEEVETVTKEVINL